MRLTVFSCLLAVMSSSHAWAQGAMQPVVPASTDAIKDMEAVVVSGVQPGPGLWKVSHGGNVLWILGTVSPVPKRMDWHSPQVEAVMADAEEIIGPPGIEVAMGAGSMFKALFAMPTLLRARQNPGGKTLREMLPPDLYARWENLKLLYLGDDKGVEEWRPMFAAGELYQAAIRRAGLQPGSGVDKRLDALVKAHEVKRTSTVVRREVKDPKGLAKSFAKSEVDDIACFRSVLDRLEADVSHAVDRANAWAAGDVEELSRLMRSGSLESCFEAVARTEAAKSLGIDEAHDRSLANWFSAVDAALKANRVSFATLPVSDLLAADGLLAGLKARGYLVQAPD